MFLGKALIVAATIVFSSQVFAAEVRTKAPKDNDRISFGLGYMIFSEALKANDTTQVDRGYANYAGVLASASYAWFENRWLYEIAGGFASGKGTAGGFASVSYPDSGRRAWSLAYLEGGARYRLNTRINLGIGLVAGYLSADWKSEQNPALKISGLNKSIYAPEFVMQWLVSNSFGITQSIATPDFRGNTMWRWGIQYNL